MAHAQRTPRAGPSKVARKPVAGRFDLFDRDFPKEDRKGLEVYENSYNVRLNKCFILEGNTLTTRDQGKTYQTK